MITDLPGASAIKELPHRKSPTKTPVIEGVETLAFRVLLIGFVVSRCLKCEARALHGKGG